LLKCANREVSTGWFLNKPNKSQMLKNNQKKVSQIYVLLVIKKIAKYKYLAISKNHFTTKQNFEVLSPNLNKIKKIKIKNV
jgi:hypothetical protein